MAVSLDFIQILSRAKSCFFIPPSFRLVRKNAGSFAFYVSHKGPFLSINKCSPFPLQEFGMIKVLMNPATPKARACVFEGTDGRLLQCNWESLFEIVKFLPSHLLKIITIMIILAHHLHLHPHISFNVTMHSIYRLICESINAHIDQPFSCLCKNSVMRHILAFFGPANKSFHVVKLDCSHLRDRRLPNWYRWSIDEARTDRTFMTLKSKPKYWLSHPGKASYLLVRLCETDNEVIKELRFFSVPPSLLLQLWFVVFYH